MEQHLRSSMMLQTSGNTKDIISHEHQEFLGLVFLESSLSSEGHVVNLIVAELPSV